MSGRPRFDLSATQVAASVLAAITGALAMSYLGVGGTIIGAGLASFASTTGTAVYKHYLWRTQERMRAAAKARAAAGAMANRASALAGQPARPLAGPDAKTQLLPPAPLPRTGPDAETHLLPPAAAARGGPDEEGHAPPPKPSRNGPDRDAAIGLSALSGFRQAGHGDVVPGQRRSPEGSPPAWAGSAPGADSAAPGPATTDAAITDSATPDGTAGHPGRDGGTGDDQDRPGSRTRPGFLGRVPRWAVITAATAGVFIIAMLGITMVEAIAGQPLEALLWHRHGSGTTMGNAVDGNTGSATSPSTAPATPSPSPSTVSSTPTPTATTTVSPSPSPTQSQPSPAPSTSPSTSPSASASPSASVSATPAGATGSRLP